MALRFLADHCISISIIQSLREANHEVLKLKDILPVESPDSLVIAKAQDIGAVLLSLNGDFAEDLRRPASELKCALVAVLIREIPANSLLEVYDANSIEESKGLASTNLPCMS